MHQNRNSFKNISQRYNNIPKTQSQAIVKSTESTKNISEKIKSKGGDSKVNN